jgi:hypothetical protein
MARIHVSISEMARKTALELFGIAKTYTPSSPQHLLWVALRSWDSARIMDLIKNHHCDVNGQAAIYRGLFAHSAPCAFHVSHRPALNNLEAPTVYVRRIVANKGTPL